MIDARRARFAIPVAMPLIRSRPTIRLSPLVFGAATALAVGLIVFVRAVGIWSADGDAALHLRLIQGIAADWELPRHLPHFPARVGDGGEIEAMFPYGYTPLYHFTGALFYRAGGATGVLLLNAISAGLIAFVIYSFVVRTAPPLVAAAAALGAGLSPRVQLPFTSIYMEPLVLALLFLGVWLLYLAVARQRPLHAFVAGMVLGLAVATRQSALLYGVSIALALSLQLLDRRPLLRKSSTELRILIAAGAGALTAALPALIYLWSVTGSIGYADVTLPGTTTALAIDPQANAYVAGITKPGDGVLVWLDRFERNLFYGDQWLPTPAFIVLVAFFAAGIVHLYSHGRAGRFFARWVALQIATDLVVFLTLHGNARYIVLSQMLFYTVVPVGAYAVVSWSLRAGKDFPRIRAASVVGAVSAIAMLSVVLFPPGYLAHYRQPYDPVREFRARAYADMGEWVNSNTRTDALFLVPRAYTAELTWNRNVTWVTFYGNYWVVDAMSSPDPAAAHRILTARGVDYVAIQDPPGTYVDRMPTDGMRSYLQLGRSNPYFILVHETEESPAFVWRGKKISAGLRLYRVTPPNELNR